MDNVPSSVPSSRTVLRVLTKPRLAELGRAVGFPLSDGTKEQQTLWELELPGEVFEIDHGPGRATRRHPAPE